MNEHILFIFILNVFGKSFCKMINVISFFLVVSNQNAKESFFDSVCNLNFILLASRYGVLGKNCITKCGYCKNCYPSNGRCWTGCNPGWKEPCCDKRRFFFLRGGGGVEEYQLFLFSFWLMVSSDSLTFFFIELSH